MSEIIEKTYNFLDTLDNSELIQNLTNYKHNLLNNKEILSKINKFKKEKNNQNKLQLKNELYKNNDYKMYMHYYQELSFIILKINQKYKEYTNTFKHNCNKNNEGV